MPSPAELHGLLEQVRELTEDVARLELEKLGLEEKLKVQELAAAELLEKVKYLTRQIDSLIWRTP